MPFDWSSGEMFMLPSVRGLVSRSRHPHVVEHRRALLREVLVEAKVPSDDEALGQLALWFEDFARTAEPLFLALLLSGYSVDALALGWVPPSGKLHLDSKLAVYNLAVNWIHGCCLEELGLVVQSSGANVTTWASWLPDASGPFIAFRAQPTHFRSSNPTAGVPNAALSLAFLNSDSQPTWKTGLGINAEGWIFFQASPGAIRPKFPPPMESVCTLLLPFRQEMVQRVENAARGPGLYDQSKKPLPSASKGLVLLYDPSAWAGQPPADLAAEATRRLNGNLAAMVLTELGGEWNNGQLVLKESIFPPMEVPATAGSDEEPPSYSERLPQDLLLALTGQANKLTGNWTLLLLAAIEVGVVDFRNLLVRPRVPFWPLPGELNPYIVEQTDSGVAGTLAEWAEGTDSGNAYQHSVTMAYDGVSEDRYFLQQKIKRSLTTDNYQVTYCSGAAFEAFFVAWSKWFAAVAAEEPGRLPTGADWLEEEGTPPPSIGYLGWKVMKAGGRFHTDWYDVDGSPLTGPKRALTRVGLGIAIGSGGPQGFPSLGARMLPGDLAKYDNSSSGGGHCTVFLEWSPSPAGGQVPTHYTWWTSNGKSNGNVHSGEGYGMCRKTASVEALTLYPVRVGRV